MDVTVIKNGQHLDHYYIHEFSSSCKEMKKYFSDSFDAFLEASGMEDCPFPAVSSLIPMIVAVIPLTVS